MSMSAWKITLMVAITVLGTIGFAYADSVKQYWGSQDKGDVARIVLPPALPLEKGITTVEVKEQAVHRDIDKDAAALPHIGPSSRFVPITDFEQVRSGRKFANGKISVLQVGAQLRSGPGFDHPRTMVVKGGLRIQILNTEGNWVHVRFPSGRQGFVHSSLVDES